MIDVILVDKIQLQLVIVLKKKIFIRQDRVAFCASNTLLLMESKSWHAICLSFHQMRKMLHTKQKKSTTLRDFLIEINEKAFFLLTAWTNKTTLSMVWWKYTTANPNWFYSEYFKLLCCYRNATVTSIYWYPEKKRHRIKRYDLNNFNHGKMNESCGKCGN